MKHASAFAPGKVIISGDHSVVYGQPAVTASLEKGVKVSLGESRHHLKPDVRAFIEIIFDLFSAEFDIELTNGPDQVLIDSEIEAGCGLGFSSAIASALFQALHKKHAPKVPLNHTTLLSLVWEAERKRYATASKIDPVTVVYGGILAFNQDRQWRQLDITPPSLWLINSGRPEESTAQMVMSVKKKVQAQSDLHAVIVEMGNVTNQIIANLKNNTLTPSLFRKNHALLDQLGVVSDRARVMIELIEQAGGAAKITGGGGKQTGSGYVLAYHPDSTVLPKLCAAEKWEHQPVF